MKSKKILLPFLSLFIAAVSAYGVGDGWLTNFDAAIAKAKAENKIVLVDFQGSDWCPPCIKLNNEVLSTDDFKSLAESSLVLVVADFPRKSSLPAGQREHNEKLAERYGIQYFPTVLLIDAEGKVLDKLVGFPRGGLEGFLSFVKAKTPTDS